MDSFIFELSKPLKYANGSGQEIESEMIELLPPTGKVSHICMDIEGLIQSGMVSMSKNFDDAELEAAKEAAKDAKEDSKIDADAVLSMMTGAGVDMKKIVLHYRQLFKEVALMGGEKKLTEPRMDDMDHMDFRRMIGEYTANFILKLGK